MDALAKLRRTVRRPSLGWPRLWWPPEWWRRIALVVVYVLAPLVLLDLAFPPPMDRVQHVSAVVTDERGAVLRAYPVDDGKWRMRAHLDEIDPAFVRALLAYEDKRFRQHGGVDPLAIVRAASSAVSAGRIVSGGSTITMQTARLLEPRPRNFGSKIIESLRAMQLEQRYTKDQILELYLTLAPYGGNLEGVRAASWAYFGREPQNLSPDQIAMLIALPQSPEARRPDLHPENAVKARARVLDRLANEGVFARDLAEESSEYPPPTRRDFPAMAWHAADEALRQSPNHDGRDIRTTLDFALQRELETLARRTGDALPDGAQAAIIVVDIRTRAVRGLVGSARRDGPGGWLDLTNRSRSPGSTLKPFIYGLAFDDGVASPNTTIADAPKRFASYRPSNFDRTFRGDVTVAQALQHSLNVPAVETLDAVGANRFAAALAMAGADLSMPLSADDDAGLAIALGGAGLTARELVSLYAALGDGGVSHPLVWLEDQVETKPKKKRDPSDGVRVMSEESAGEIVSILAASPAPEGRMPAKLTKDAPVIAFKTGTSYGFRDAWAAGVAGGYAAVVWIGRADGAPRPNATGRATALPVLFEAFDAVERIRPQNDHDLRNTHVDDEAPPQPLARFGDPAAAPHILFPPDKSEVWNDREHRSLVFAAEGAGPLRWFVDGAPVRRNAAGDAVWRPDLPGFYEVSVVDEHGREARSRIRIRTPEG